MSSLQINLSPEGLILVGFAVGWFAGILAGATRLIFNWGRGEAPL